MQAFKESKEEPETQGVGKPFILPRKEWLIPLPVLLVPTSALVRVQIGVGKWREKEENLSPVPSPKAGDHNLQALGEGRTLSLSKTWRI